jgi:DNA-binding response OmpR family regulator
LPTYAFCGDESEYARSLLEGLDLLGVETAPLFGPDELEALSVDGLSAIVLANPPSRLARDMRMAMDRVGGWVSRVPLLAALGSMDHLDDLDTLRVVDDFLVAPGGAGELVSRVKVIILRRGGDGEVVSFGGLVINLEAHQVLIEGKPIDMTYKEFELLRTLASSPGRAYSREELLRGIWGYDYYGGTRTVDVHIRRLRSKIEGSRRYIETVHSVGYRFVST